MAEITIDVRDVRAFKAAVDTLKAYAKRGRAPRTQNLAVAIAALMYRDFDGKRGLPGLIQRVGGMPITTTSLQRDVCDALYHKQPAFLPADAEGPIYKPLTDSFKPTSATSNNWRNSFDLQMGLSCDAPYTPEFLQSPSFLSEPRFDCPFRNSTTGSCSSPSGNVQSTRTCFNPNKKDVPGLSTRASMTPKLLHRGAADGGVGYWLVEPTKEVLMDLLGDPANRIPLYPFMAALYCGSTALTRTRSRVGRTMFRSDIGLDDERFTSLFDVDLRERDNAAFLSSLRLLPDVERNEAQETPSANSGESSSRSRRSLELPQIASGSRPYESSGPESEVPYVPGKELKTFALNAQTLADPQKRMDLLEKASRGHARTLDELYRILTERGFSCFEQHSGYDLLAVKNGRMHLFEVKTWRPENLQSQIRSAIAQLYEYRWKNRSRLGTASLYIVLDHPPAANDFAQWGEYLHVDREILLCSIDERNLATVTAYAHKLPS